MTLFRTFCPAVLGASPERFLGGSFNVYFPDLWLKCCFPFVFIDLFLIHGVEIPGHTLSTQLC